MTYNNENSLASQTINKVNIENNFAAVKTISVSKLNSYLINEFDAEACAKKCEEIGRSDPNYKYAGMSADDILKLWDDKRNESLRYGNLLDDYVGMVLNDKNKELEIWKLDNNYNDDAMLNSLCTGFNQFLANIVSKTNYRYVSREMQVFIKSRNNNMINGRFDCLFYDKNTDGYIIFDWKTTEDINFTNSKKMKGPAYSLDDCKGNLYTLQLQLYKKALIETYNMATENKISIYICKFMKKPDENGLNYKLLKPNFQYDSEFLDKCIDFAVMKNNLL